ncbi:MAG: hemerythrin domain-containing protein [Chthonomonadetes bacterium]|nr:hemerythrin domain-containing protein [Chthonomonadetes bacterium]
MSHQQFAEQFRAEHRQVRDLLLQLLQAFEQRNTSRASELVRSIAALTGPHFRYEEEAVYPALVPIFGDDYVQKLLSDHDRVISSAARLSALAQKQALEEGEVQEAVRLIRGILPHVSDCDGLSIMVECLPDEQVKQIMDTRSRSLADNVDLLRWATTLRERPVTLPAQA